MRVKHHETKAMSAKLPFKGVFSLLLYYFLLIVLNIILFAVGKCPSSKLALTNKIYLNPGKFFKGTIKAF